VGLKEFIEEERELAKSKYLEENEVEYQGFHFGLGKANPNGIYENSAVLNCTCLLCNNKQKVHARKGNERGVFVCFKCWGKSLVVLK